MVSVLMIQVMNHIHYSLTKYIFQSVKSPVRNRFIKSKSNRYIQTTLVMVWDHQKESVMRVVVIETMVSVAGILDEILDLKSDRSQLKRLQMERTWKIIKTDWVQKKKLVSIHFHKCHAHWTMLNLFRCKMQWRHITNRIAIQVPLVLELVTVIHHRQVSLISCYSYMLTGCFKAVGPAEALTRGTLTPPAQMTPANRNMMQNSRQKSNY